jgi:long-chain fatty acid transport protein
MIFKPKAISLAVVAICSAGSVVAGGADITLMPTEMMFEKGNYVEVSVAKVSRNVAGTIVAPSGSMYPDYNVRTLAAKVELNDKISVGFADYLSASIQVDYRKAGASGLAAGYATAFVDLDIRSRLLAIQYQVNDNVSILGGWKHSKTSNASANVLKNPVGTLSIPSASDSALALGVAYEKPEIALRVSALYQSATKFDLPMTTAGHPQGSVLLNGKAGLPKSMTLRFQSGVAKDTLIFGSAHRGDWAKSQIEFETDFSGNPSAFSGKSGVLGTRSSFTTTTAYTLGLGRKLSEKYAVSATYGWEKGSGATGTSLLSTTNGKKSLTLGGKYTSGRMALSAGYSRIKPGSYTATTPLGGAVFSNSSANVIGVKLGLSL